MAGCIYFLYLGGWGPVSYHTPWNSSNLLAPPPYDFPINFNDFIGPQTGKFANCAPEISKIYYKLYREWIFASLSPPPLGFPSCFHHLYPWIFAFLTPLPWIFQGPHSPPHPPPPHVQKINAICQCLCVSLIRTVFLLAGNGTPQIPGRNSQSRPAHRQTTLVNCPYKNWHMYFPDDGMALLQ